MTKICKWGNSLGLRLPAPVALAGGFKAGTRVCVRLLDNGSLLITPLSKVAHVMDGLSLKMSIPAETRW